ncbi:MAG: hypothetical protein ACRECQ_01535, partial [Burkholderiaceae bacterium]
MQFRNLAGGGAQGTLLLALSNEQVVVPTSLRLPNASAFTGQYSELAGKPAGFSNADWAAGSGWAQVLNKPTALSAFTNDLGTFANAVTLNGAVATQYGISVTTNDPGALIQRSYDNADRYGIGQHAGGVTSVFCSSTYAPARVSLSRATGANTVADMARFSEYEWSIGSANYERFPSSLQLSPGPFQKCKSWVPVGALNAGNYPNYISVTDMWGASTAANCSGVLRVHWTLDNGSGGAAMMELWVCKANGSTMTAAQTHFIASTGVVCAWSVGAGSPDSVRVAINQPAANMSFVFNGA